MTANNSPETLQFATLNDLATRWPGMPNDPARITVLLQDASQFLVDTVPTARRAAPSTQKRIVCAVVRRHLEAEQHENHGVSNHTVGAGPYQETMTFHNPDGGFYLRGDEKIALGRGHQKAGSVDLLGGHEP